MCYDVFAARSRLLPLNVSVLTALTPCEPPLRPRRRVGGDSLPSREGVGTPTGGHAGRGVGWETVGTETCGAHVLRGTGVYASEAAMGPETLLQKMGPLVSLQERGCDEGVKKSKSKPTACFPHTQLPKPKYHSPHPQICG